MNYKREPTKFYSSVLFPTGNTRDVGIPDLIGNRRKHSVSSGSSGYQNWTTSVKSTQAVSGMHHYQPTINPDSANFPGDPFPVVDNFYHYQHEKRNGQQPAFNRNIVNTQSAQHPIGYNTFNSQCYHKNRNGFRGVDHWCNCVEKNGATKEHHQQTSNPFPTNPRNQHQFSTVGSNSKNNFLFPHLTDSLIRESRTDDSVLTPYQIAAVKFLLVTAPHMFQIGIEEVGRVIDQWDNPVPQLTGNFQFGDNIWSNGTSNGGM